MPELDITQVRQEQEASYGNVVQPVDIPASSVAGEFTRPSPNAFDFQAEEDKGTIFDGDFSVQDQPKAVDRPLTTSMIALATADLNRVPALALQQQALDAAQAALDQGGEFGIRLKIANERSLNTLRNLDSMKKTVQNSAPNTFSPDATARIDEAYARTVNQYIEDKAHTALEFETVERIQDVLANGDTVQAKVLWDLYSRGNAQKVMHDEAVKNLIMAQRIQELEQETKNQSWGRWMTNLVTSVIPLKSNFARSGVIDDAGIPNNATTVLNWILSGSGLQKQGEALWSLSPDEFAKALSKDGPVMASVRQNAQFILENPDEELDILNALNYQSNSDKNWANLWGVADVGLTVAMTPVAKLTKVPGVLARLGARETAAKRVAEAYDITMKESAEAAFKKTGINENEVTEALEPSAIQVARDPDAVVSLGVDVETNLKAARQALDELPELIQSARLSTPEEAIAAYEGRVKELTSEYGNGIKDVRYLEESVVTGEAAEFTGSIAEQGNIVRKVEVTFGKTDGGGYARESTAHGGATRYGFSPDEVETFQDASGQWYFKTKLNVREEGFAVKPLETPAVNGTLSVFRSTARLTDAEAQGKALSAGARAGKIMRSINEKMYQSLKGIDNDSKTYLDQIIRKGQNEQKWFTDSEFETIYERSTGTPAPAKVKQAYRDYIKFNDMDYHLRNDLVYQQKAAQGAESVRFSLGKTGFNIDADATINFSPTKRPLREVFNASEGKWLTDVKADDIKEMSGRGYVSLHTLEDVRFPDGQVARDFMIKKSDLERRALRRTQLAYSQGGHRAYTGKVFAKQAMKDSKGRLLNPNVFVTGNNVNEVKTWVDTMNDAIRYVKGEGADPQHLDDVIFQGRKGFPTGREFLDQVEEGRISTDDFIEAVYDREMPSAYMNMRDDVLNFVDEAETAVEGYYRTTGRMYYGRKGEHLKDTFGDFAETVDPWETLNTALSRITEQSSFSGYKDNVLERFKNTYSKYLELKNLDNSANLYDVVKAKVRSGTPHEIERKIKQEQAAIQRILRFESGYEKKLRQTQREVAEWVLGDDKEGIRAVAHDFVYWLGKNNPVNAIKAFQFDAKLGFWNPIQLPLQMSTTLAAIFLNKSYGLKGVAAAAPMTMWATMKYDGKVLDQLAKNGVWKVSGFSSEQEFKEFAHLVQRSSILDVGNTHLQIGDYGTSRVFGAMSKVQHVREAGRALFYGAEKVNRTVAARIAWGELQERGVKLGTSEFREEFVRLTDDYSLNMMNESSAAFQHGLTSIPTQFWSYSFRMMDAMFGKRFTPKQRAKLIASQFILAGAAGVPFGEQIAEFVKEDTGQELDIATWQGALERGWFDKAIYELAGADIRAGERIGTGGLVTDIVADLFNLGEYGPKSLAEFAAGATGGFVISASETILRAKDYAIAETGGDLGIPISTDTYIELANEISTFSSLNKAYWAKYYGVYRSKKGNVLAADIPEESVIWIGLGFSPQEVKEVNTKFDYIQDNQEFVKDAKKLVRKWREEAFYNPDKYSENMKKVNTFIQTLPPSVRVDLYRTMRTEDDGSFAAYVGKKYEEEVLRQQLDDELVKEEEVLRNGQ